MLLKMPVCSKCQIEVSDDLIVAKKSCCRECNKAYCKAYKAANRDKISAYNHKYKSEHKQEVSSYNHTYNTLHKNALVAAALLRKKRRFALEPEFKIACNLRKKLWRLLKRQCKCQNVDDVVRFVGCKPDQFKGWIESQFDASMTWDNYGTMWSIDHVIPCSSINLEDDEQQIKSFNWSNLRPVVKAQNYRKSATVDHQLIEQHNLLAQQYAKSHGIDLPSRN